MSGSGCCHPPRMTGHYRYPQQTYALFLWSPAIVGGSAPSGRHLSNRGTCRRVRRVTRRSGGRRSPQEPISMLGITVAWFRCLDGVAQADPASADPGSWRPWGGANGRGRGRTARGRRRRPSDPTRSGRPGGRLPAGRGGEPRGARPGRAGRRSGRRADRGAPDARAQGPAAGARHPRLPHPHRGRHRTAVLARPGTVRGRGDRRARRRAGHRAGICRAHPDRGRPLRPDARRLRSHRPGDAHLRLPRARLGRGRRRGRRDPQPHPGVAAGADPPSPRTPRSGRARTPATRASAPRPGTAGPPPAPTRSSPTRPSTTG